MSFIVVGYYTKGTLYEEKARIFRASLERFGVPHYIKAVDDLGTWQKNTSYKPTFIKEMMSANPATAVIYIDVDAEFFRYPQLFENLVATQVDVAVYVFDRSCYKKSAHGFEVLSGTVFLGCTERARKIVDDWERECNGNSRIWDQKVLEKVLGGVGGQFHRLPGEYCKIFDRMNDIVDPVIVHYQASREFRRVHPDRVY
ncbi:MAG: putative nucleotide-diphospho-sugar transferase [Candidatus Thorarchaeota archaeon]